LQDRRCFNIKFIDFFAGVGGFREGLEKEGFECVGWCEFDKFKQQAYRTVHDTEGEWFNADITDVQPEDLPEADLFVGGFPCQSFSIAGKRGGFEDTRGTLFFEVARLARARKPKYLLLENVKGLLNHDNGNTFSTILNTMAELGYEWEYQVLNSKDFGVPQNRERVFIIGHLRGQPRPKVFPFRGEKRGNPEQFSRGGGIAYNLDANYSKGTSPGDVEKGRRTHIILKNHRNIETRNHGEISPTLNKVQGGGQIPLVYSEEIRSLTPLEAFRLQGFPDEWYYKCREAGISDTQMYRAAGDSVTVNVVQAIARRLK